MLRFPLLSSSGWVSPQVPSGNGKWSAEMGWVRIG